MSSNKLFLVSNLWWFFVFFFFFQKRRKGGGNLVFPKNKSYFTCVDLVKMDLSWSPDVGSAARLSLPPYEESLVA